MRLSIVMTTAPRPIATLDRSLASCAAAGFDPIHISCDDKRRGDNKANFLCALDMAIADDGDYCMILEDDVTFVPDAHAQLTSRLFDDPTFGVLSLHCMGFVSQQIEKSLGISPGKLVSGVYRSHLGANTWGSQALVFPRSVAIRLAKWDGWHNVNAPTGTDRSVFGLLARWNLPALFLLPCIARHDLGIGNSACGLPELPGRACDY